MTSDTSAARELLEQAAKAIGRGFLTGYEWIDTPFYTGFMRRNRDDDGFEIQTSDWNPLDDERDALRLAVRLRMEVQVNELSVIVRLPQNEIGITPPLIHEYTDEHQGHDQATRRAIVRAAAEIGKAKP